ncbi:MAG TPA: hypothetical protein VLB84_03840 [Bacteroidia bacterium]|jgi:hypothetical protein|nr:hypothetical protein [Bacteroidia bacterium]
MTAIIKKRPILVTVACIIGYVAVVFYFIGVFAPAIKKLGDFYPALLGIIVAAYFISVIGIWHMKRWGLLLFICVFFIKLLFQILVNDIGIAGTIISVFIISAVIPFYKRMDLNL